MTFSEEQKIKLYTDLLRARRFDRLFAGLITQGKLLVVMTTLLARTCRQIIHKRESHPLLSVCDSFCPRTSRPAVRSGRRSQARPKPVPAAGAPPASVAWAAGPNWL